MSCKYCGILDLEYFPDPVSYTHLDVYKRQGYGKWLHGEAVAAGTMMAAELSHQLGWIDLDDLKRIENLFERAGLPVFGPAMGTDRYLELMQHDKKVQDGKLRLVLFKQIGQAVVSDMASPTEIGKAITARSTDV